jgi:DNA-binding FadR family transcriptional regulator
LISARICDFDAFNKADIDFHTALQRASGNVVFQQLSNMIGAALAYSFQLTIERAREPGASLPNHGEVIECIRLRDSEGAFALMSHLLNIAVIDLGLWTAGRNLRNERLKAAENLGELALGAGAFGNVDA